MYKICSKCFIVTQLSLLHIELYFSSIMFYWHELNCRFLQGYLKPRINELFFFFLIG